MFTEMQIKKKVPFFIISFIASVNGNLLDKVIYGYVRDFLAIKLGKGVILRQKKSPVG